MKESKEWTKATYRTNNNKKAGIIVYIPKSDLEEMGFNTEEQILQKRYPTKKKTVIIELKQKGE